MKKITFIIFSLLFTKALLASGNPLKRVNTFQFTSLIEGTPHADQNSFQIASPTEEDQRGFHTTGLSPCFCFIVFDKQTGKTLFMSHYGPSSSSASFEEAKRDVEGHLDELLLNLEQNYFEESDLESDSEEEENPLSSLVSIVVLGGKEASSGNSIQAIKEIAKEQYFPLSFSALNLAKPKEVLDVYAKDIKNIYIHLAEMAEE